MKRRFLPFSIMLALVTSSGCSNPKPPIADLPPAVVSVAKPITDRAVRDYQQFLATLDAAESIEVRSRVTGYLKEIKFTPGQTVEKNKTVLFVIDRRPFEATFQKADGEMKIAEAELRLAKKEKDRVAKLLDSKNASLEDRDKALAQVEVSEAKLAASVAARDQAKINLDFTEIKADVDGVVGRNLITEGNLVNADTTLLTTIVKPDPVFAYFDVDQPAVERYHRTHKVDPDMKPPSMPIELGLESDSNSFPYIGAVNFADARLNPSTGALQIRAIFARKDLKPNQAPLQPGYTARVRVATDEPFKPILVPDRAVGTDQGQKYVYVVNADKKVEYRKIQIGTSLYTLNEGNMLANFQAVNSGLDGSESVIVIGLQRVRPGVVVDPQEIDPITERPVKEKAAPVKKK